MRDQCKLCKQQKKLIKAHLLPDGLKKFAMSETDSSLVMIDTNTGWHKHKQTLEYDQGILCQDCDGMIGRSEDAFQTFIQSFLDHPDRNKTGNQKIAVHCLSNRIIMAVLAILLKYSFSSRHSHIQLGPKYERIISDAILSDKIPKEYGTNFQIVFMGSNSYVVERDGTEMDLSRIARAHVSGGRTGNYHTYFIQPPGTWVAIKVGNASWHPLASQEAVESDSDHIIVHTSQFEKSILHEDMLSGAAKRFKWIEDQSKERAKRHSK